MSNHSESNTGKGHVLVVDDSEDNRAIISRFLKSGGYTTTECTDGVEALAMLADWQPDLVVLDWMMPRLGGMEVLRSVRSRQTLAQLPIIMCTARDEQEGIQQALNAGANDYISKPVSREIMLARVKAQLDRKQALDALSAVTADLERALADRTRSLLDVRSVRPLGVDALEEILNLAKWLQNDPQADKQEFRIACAASITNAARRLATS